MQFEITDRAAIIFAEEFYAALVDGLAVDAALAESRKAIYGDGNDVEGGGQSCSCEYATGSCSTCRNYLRMRRWFLTVSTRLGCATHRTSCDEREDAV